MQDFFIYQLHQKTDVLCSYYSNYVSNQMTFAHKIQSLQMVESCALILQRYGLFEPFDIKKTPNSPLGASVAE